MVLVAIVVVACQAQDYDDENYGGQGGNNNQGDNDGYNGGYSGNDDGYNQNVPNYQQNVDSDGSNQSPSSYNPQGGSGGDADGDYEGDDGTAAAAASSLNPTVLRVRRSVEKEMTKPAASEAKLRVKRHGKYYIGPVYTYVKTDKHANFKWGVKHKVGKKHHG